MAKPAAIENLVAMRIGCDSAVWAPLTSDDGTELEYGVVVSLPGLMSIEVNPNTDAATAFYDDGPGETASTLGEIEVTMSKSALGPKEKATLLGHGLTSDGLLIYGAADTPPWGALGFRTLQSDGTYRYVWLLKGKFTDPSDSNETRGESIALQNDEITGSFVKVNKQFTFTDTIGTGSKTVQPWKTEANEGGGATAGLIEKWFDAPVTPSISVGG